MHENCDEFRVIRNNVAGGFIEPSALNANWKTQEGVAGWISSNSRFRR